ncbi:MAG: type I methionyl aminopeptidase [Clostridia bacterium]|nr:type I methionyl aminopeptidase [Clostridia bacterium]
MQIAPRKNADETVREYLARLRSLGFKTPTSKMIKSEEDIVGCLEAGRINSLVLDEVEKHIEIGMSTQDIDDIVVRKTRELGGRCACLGYEGFPKSVCTSLNRVVCHGIPSHRDILREGDILNVDCTTEYRGYFGDASRMFCLGKISSEAEKLVRVTREALECAVSHIVPYESHLGDIGYYISRHARANGFSVVREIGGHGVGIAMHEDPYVCHTGLLGSGMVILPGMIFTVEPMVNAGKPSFYIDSRDGWTVYTSDGKLSAQIEYELLITEDGAEIISR